MALVSSGPLQQEMQIFLSVQQTLRSQIRPNCSATCTYNVSESVLHLMDCVVFCISRYMSHCPPELVKPRNRTQISIGKTAQFRITVRCSLLKRRKNEMQVFGMRSKLNTSQGLMWKHVWERDVLLPFHPSTPEAVGELVLRS